MPDFQRFPGDFYKIRGLSFVKMLQRRVVVKIAPLSFVAVRWRETRDGLQDGKHGMNEDAGRKTRDGIGDMRGAGQ
jgi:hypothetical protein